MKYRLEIEGDWYEDSVQLKELAMNGDCWLALWEVRSQIRSRLKYETGVSDEEERFLEQLQETLYIPGMD